MVKSLSTVLKKIIKNLVNLTKPIKNINDYDTKLNRNHLTYFTNYNFVILYIS